MSRVAVRTAFAFWATLVSFSACPISAAEFRVGKIEPATPIERIKLTITLAPNGADLDEPVDLHLGLGFPLRLFPLGADRREPGFAAIPQTTTLPAGATTLKAGETASFEFILTSPTADNADVLKTTPELLRDLRERDVAKIGFASRGKSDWILQDYAIEMNGKPLASHTGMNARCQLIQQANQQSLQEAIEEYETLSRDSKDKEAAVLSGLASDAEIVILQELQKTLAEKADTINDLAARITGALPWYTHQGEDFPPAPIKGDLIHTLEVTLVPQETDRSGSRNPLYLWADGRKYSLTSEADPLVSGSVPQTFQISAPELEANPLTRRRVHEIGIGMVANDDPRSKTPDRVRLQRVLVRADGEPIYDSDQTPADIETLKKIALIPPAHRDEKGKVVVNKTTPSYLTLWRSGHLLPEGAAVVDPNPAAEEPAAATPSDPTASEPQVVFVPYDNNGLNAPRRRRLPRRNGRTPVVVNVNLPSSPTPPALTSTTPPATLSPSNNNAGKTTPRPITPTPAPAAPVLANIRINPAIPILRNGDQAAVNWQVSGDTSNVRSYRVDIFGVLPHKNPPLVGVPLATQTNIPPQATSAGGTQTMLARPPAIAASNIASKITTVENLYLYAQPKVTALAADGTALVSGFGSLMPLFPSQAASPYNVVLVPGQVMSKGVLVANVVRPPSFQILPPAAPGLPWQSSPSTDPQIVSSSWPIFGEQDASFALTFASYVPSLGALGVPSYNLGIRPASNGQRIAVQYEAVAPIPGTMPTPARGWRLVGHVGFMGGSTPCTALVQTKIDAAVRPAAPAPFFTMQTPNPIPYAKFSSGTTPAPCLLIDMPVRFDLMAQRNLAASPHDATKYAISSFVINNGLNGYAFLGNGGNGPNLYFTVTLMIALQSTDVTDAVGVFGLRLVPDNNP